MSDLKRTKDYELFKLIDENRDVNQTRVSKLIASIKTKNMLEDFPIIVNKKMEILDGQGRFFACKKLGIDIYYRFSKAIEIENISLINSVSAKWSPADYLKMYSSLGNINYIKLKKFWGRSGLSSIRLCTTLLKKDGGSTSRGQSGFKDGLYQYPKDDSFAWDILSDLADLKAYIPFANKTSLQLAFIHIRKQKEYIHKTMLSKLKLCAYDIRPASTANEYIEQLEKVFNYRVADSKYKRFKRIS